MTLETELRTLLEELQRRKRSAFRRRVPVGDLLTERHDIAREYGFGDGTTCYDSVLIFGDVRVGRNTWIGPNVLLDGSGGTLEIGDYCSISAGTQVYTHNTVKWAITMGAAEAERAPTRIGSGVFIGPHSVITKGITIGDRVIVGAFSFVDSDIPSGKEAFGQPARIKDESSIWLTRHSHPENSV